MMAAMTDDRSYAETTACRFRGCDEPADPATLQDPGVRLEVWSSSMTEFGRVDTPGQTGASALPLCDDHNRLILAIARQKGVPARRRDPAIARLAIRDIWDRKAGTITEIWVEEATTPSDGGAPS